MDTKKPVCLAHSEGRGKGAQETERNYGEFTSASRSETDTPLPAHVQVSLKDPDLQAGNHGPHVSMSGCTTPVTGPPLRTGGWKCPVYCTQLPECTLAGSQGHQKVSSFAENMAPWLYI